MIGNPLAQPGGKLRLPLQVDRFARPIVTVAHHTVVDQKRHRSVDLSSVVSIEERHDRRHSAGLSRR